MAVSHLLKRTGNTGKKNGREGEREKGNGPVLFSQSPLLPFSLSQSFLSSQSKFCVADYSPEKFRVYTTSCDLKFSRLKIWVVSLACGAKPLREAMMIKISRTLNKTLSIRVSVYDQE
jgi:hypothetical protein